MAAVKIPDGRYLMGVELGNETETTMVLVPVGPRNIPNWARMFSVSESDFSDLMRQKAKQRHERREAAEAAKAKNK